MSIANVAASLSLELCCMQIIALVIGDGVRVQNVVSLGWAFKLQNEPSLTGTGFSSKE
jgi:hypothetical protein